MHYGYILWRPIPKGLDACTITEFFDDLNQGCISKRTPGFEDMEMRVALDAPLGGGSPFSGAGFQLKCSNLDMRTKQALTGCWVNPQGRNFFDYNFTLKT